MRTGEGLTFLKNQNGNMTMKHSKSVTPRSRIQSNLRMLWLRSRERAAALKRDGYTCQNCHRKQSKSKNSPLKIEVHHINGVRWNEIIDHIYQELLVNPEKLITLCKECHGKAV